MTGYYGDFAEDATVLIPFNTFSSDDPSASVTITNLADADIMVHKDASLTQIVTDGASVVINFDGITGNHMVTIDTSAHADYSVGSEYAVRIEGITVDGATINAWIGAFSIERASGALAIAKLIQAAVITNAAGDDVAADIIAVKAETANILTDTGTTLQAELDAIQAAVITNAAGVDIAADIITVKSTVDNVESGVGIIVQDTDELQTDWVDGGRLDLLINDIQSRLPAALLSGRMNSDVIALVGQTGAATRLERMFSSGHHGVAQAGTASTITLASGADSNDNFYRGSVVVTSNFTGKKQYRFVHAFDGTSKVASVTPDWIVTPNNTTEYVVLPFGFADTVAISGAVAAADAVTEARLAELDAANLPARTDGIQTDLSNATDGLGALKTLIDTLDTVADAIKVVTDKLAFTVANQVDANIQSVNDQAVTGDGGSGTEWSGA